MAATPAQGGRGQGGGKRSHSTASCTDANPGHFCALAAFPPAVPCHGSLVPVCAATERLRQSLPACAEPTARCSAVDALYRLAKLAPLLSAVLRSERAGWSPGLQAFVTPPSALPLALLLAAGPCRSAGCTAAALLAIGCSMPLGDARCGSSGCQGGGGWAACEVEVAGALG